MFTSTLILSLVAAVAANCGTKNNTGGAAPGAGAGAKAQCALQFDGRIPKAFTAADFDGTSSPFNAQNVFGKGLKFSELIQLPEGVSSLVSDQPRGRPPSVSQLPRAGPSSRRPAEHSLISNA